MIIAQLLHTATLRPHRFYRLCLQPPLFILGGVAATAVHFRGCGTSQTCKACERYYPQSLQNPCGCPSIDGAFWQDRAWVLSLDSFCSSACIPQIVACVGLRSPLACWVCSQGPTLCRLFGNIFHWRIFSPPAFTGILS